jgi:hypothetical protein
VVSTEATFAIEALIVKQLGSTAAMCKGCLVIVRVLLGVRRKMIDESESDAAIVDSFKSSIDCRHPIDRLLTG